VQFNYDFGNTQAVIVTRRGRLFVPIWHFAVYGNCLNIASTCQPLRRQFSRCKPE